MISLVNLLLNQRAGFRGEVRTQYRNLLSPHIVEFGEQLHEAVAMANIAAKRAATGQPTDQYQKKCRAACARLKELRRKLKYPLWEIDEPIRTITRLGSWMDHRLSEPKKAEALVAEAEKLRNALDRAIRSSFVRGRPPRWHETRSAKCAAERLRKDWGDGAPSTGESEDESNA